MIAKVVHVISGLFTGGAETMLYKLLRTMDRERFEHEVVSLSDGAWPMADRIESLGVRVHRCRMRPGSFHPAAAIDAVRQIRRTAPDLLHGWMHHGNLAALAARWLSGSLPLIWTVCDARLRHEKFTTTAAARLAALLSRFPDHIVSDSHAGAQAHQRRLNFRSKPWEIIPNGFDLDQFQPSASARAAVRAELNIPFEAPLVGLVGRYSAVKGQAFFLDAAKLIHRLTPDTRFLLAGRDVGGNPALLAQIGSLGLSGVTHLMGERSDVPRIMAALDIAVSSSHSESLPTVIGEAMCCGAPCVVTDVGDSRRLVGETGLVVPPADSDALALACVSLILGGSQRRQALGLAARRRIVEHFSLAELANRYEQVYRQALDRKQNRKRHTRAASAWSGS